MKVLVLFSLFFIKSANFKHYLIETENAVSEYDHGDDYNMAPISLENSPSKIATGHKAMNLNARSAQQSRIATGDERCNNWWGGWGCWGK